MALFDAVLVPAGRATKVANLAASASSTEQLLGENKLFAISATTTNTPDTSRAVHIRFGQIGMGAADATDFLINAGTTAVFDSGHEFTYIRLFNSGASGIDVYIQPLSRF